MPPAVLMSTASSVGPGTRGMRTRREPDSATRTARVATPPPATVIPTRPSARWRRGSAGLIVSERKALAYIVPREGGAVAGLDDLAPLHDDETVGQLARKVKILLDEENGHVALGAQIGDGAADILDDRGLDP